MAFLTEAALVLAPAHPEALTYLRYVLTVYRGVFPPWGKDDGGWNEWPHYWGAYVSFATDALLAVRNALGYDLFRLPFFRQTPYYPFYVSPPGSKSPLMGDGEPIRHIDITMRNLAIIGNDLTLLRYLEPYRITTAKMPGLLLTPPQLPAGSLPTLPTARLFSGVGLAVMRTELTDSDNDVRFLFQSNPYGSVSHGHSNQNCFTLDAFGEPLAIASGYYDYFASPHHFKWTQTTKANCGITVDGGQGQPRGPQSAGAITAFAHHDDFDLAVGDASRAYGPLLTRAVREVVHVRPGIFVMRDDLVAATPRRFEYRLHAAAKISCDQVAGIVTIARPKASLTVRLFPNHPLTFSQDHRFEPAPVVARDPKLKYRDQHHFCAVSEPETELNLISVLLPSRTGAEKSLPTVRKIIGTGGEGVELSYPGGGKVIVGFAVPGKSGVCELDGITTDARTFAVKLSAAGQPVAWLVRQGSRLEYRGDRLYHSSRREPVVVASKEKKLR